MNKKTTVIYHSADFDGLFCREIARKFLPDAELIGWDFPDAPINPAWLSAGGTDQIIIMDLPVDRVFGFKMDELVKDEKFIGIKIGDITDIVWIDHHKSSIESHPASIPGYRIDGVAACRLAWQWFIGKDKMEQRRSVGLPPLPLKEEFIARKLEEPYAVQLAGEYDIWDKRNPDAETFQFGLRSRELTNEDWAELLGIITVYGMPGLTRHLLMNGRLLQRYQQGIDAGVVNYRSFMVEFEGLKFLALNTARCNSLTFAAKDIPETGHDALMGFYWDGTAWNVSLYHAKHRTELDLSQIAVKFGGGGHRGACGFQISKLPFAG